MNIDDLKNINFWTREFKVPLFILTNKTQKIYSENTLILFKNPTLHLYSLNNREEKISEETYHLFQKENALKEFRDQSKRITEIIDELNKNCQKEANEKQLKTLFFNSLEVLSSYSNLYLNTEPFSLIKINAEDDLNFLTRELGEIRLALRRKSQTLFYCILGILLKKISKQFKLKTSELYFCTYEDMVKLFDGMTIEPNIIRERSKGYALINMINSPTIIIGSDFRKIFREVVNRGNKTNRLEGQVAMNGLAKGKARVIKHNKRNMSQEIAKFKKGEILVTEMTRPDIILISKKAAAIITDEGGMSSHAAIISREYGIPCIVGTENATQIIKNGDFLEVDANNGIVKILKDLNKKLPVIS